MEATFFAEINWAALGRLGVRLVHNYYWKSAIQLSFLLECKIDSTEDDKFFVDTVFMFWCRKSATKSYTII